MSRGRDQKKPSEGGRGAGGLIFGGLYVWSGYILGWNLGSMPNQKMQFVDPPKKSKVTNIHRELNSRGYELLWVGQFPPGGGGLVIRGLVSTC